MKIIYEFEDTKIELENVKYIERFAPKNGVFISDNLDGKFVVMSAEYKDETKGSTITNFKELNKLDSYEHARAYTKILMDAMAKKLKELGAK